MSGLEVIGYLAAAVTAFGFAVWLVGSIRMHEVAFYTGVAVMSAGVGAMLVVVAFMYHQEPETDCGPVIRDNEPEYVCVEVNHDEDE